MAAAFLLSWQPKIKKQGFNFTENSIVKIKGLYILAFDKKHLLRKILTWTINCQYTLLPHPHARIFIEFYIHSYSKCYWRLLLDLLGTCYLEMFAFLIRGWRVCEKIEFWAKLLKGCYLKDSKMRQQVKCLMSFQHRLSRWRFNNWG